MCSILVYNHMNKYIHKQERSKYSLVPKLLVLYLMRKSICARSILVGGGNELTPKASAETWINMANRLQEGSLSTRLRIPIIIGTDVVHGHNNAYNATIFPQNVGLGVIRQVFTIFFMLKIKPATLLVP